MSPSWFEQANAWLSQALGSSTGVASFLLLIWAGVLASLLPCVYPLYPITAAFLSRRESRLGRLAHPQAYYVGLALIYFTFGVVASVTGGSFNEVLRLPIANLFHRWLVGDLGPSDRRLKVRDNTTLFEQYHADPRFPELKVGLPFFLITDPKEALLYKTSDFTKTDEMALFLNE